MTVHEIWTRWSPEEVIERAEAFFCTAASPRAAFVQERSATYLKLHQEVGEIVVSALPERGGSRVRGSASRGAPLLARFIAALAHAQDVAQRTDRYQEHRRWSAEVEAYPAPAAAPVRPVETTSETAAVAAAA